MAVPILLMMTGCGTTSPSVRTEDAAPSSVTADPSASVGTANAFSDRLGRPDLASALGCEMSGMVIVPLYTGASEQDALASLGRAIAEHAGEVVFEPWMGRPVMDAPPTTGWYLAFTKDGHRGVTTAHAFLADDGSYHAVFGPGCR